jgi:hypothetical protein
MRTTQQSGRHNNQRTGRVLQAVLRSQYVACSKSIDRLFWLGDLVSVLPHCFLLAWTPYSQRADHSDVGVLTRGYSRTRRLRSTDQGKGGSDIDAGEGEAEPEADRQRSCN